MVTQVDPFVIPIPRKLLDDKESRIYFEYLNRFLHDLWTRTGGGNDEVAESQIGELYEPGIQVSNADELIEDLEVDFEIFSRQDFDPSSASLEIVVVTGDYTTTGNQAVVVNSASPVTITANPSPDTGEFFHVIRYGKGVVKVQASNLINGKPSKTIIRQYTAPKHLYIAELDTWNTI